MNEFALIDCAVEEFILINLCLEETNLIEYLVICFLSKGRPLLFYILLKYLVLSAQFSDSLIVKFIMPSVPCSHVYHLKVKLHTNF